MYWNTFNGRSDFFFGLGRQPLIDANCPVNTCTFTDDLGQFNQSDVVLFNIQALDDHPPHRFEHQRFVFYQMESPENTWPIALMDRSKTRFNYFNWTMTYRLDSDIVQRDWYGAVKNKRSSRTVIYPEKRLKPSTVYLKRPKSDSDVWRGKKKMAVWIATHSPTPIRREDYIRQLSQYIQVDIYGTLGNLTCGEDDICLSMVRRDYKFYLSFENSWCADYVTEKFYRPLLYDTVPIVLGGVDYDQFAPPHSYINAFDFPSAKELAEYLHLLDRNEDLYARYFDWKRHYEVIKTPKNGWCELCKMANDPKLPVKVYSDVKRWWEDGGRCLFESFEYF